MFAEDEARLIDDAARDAGHREQLVTRRVAGEPLEHVLGWAEFAGLRILLDPGVFVPRQRTVLLVEQAIALARSRAGAGSRPVIVDLCCGSGAIGAALAAAVPNAEVFAADIDPGAVAAARRNLPPDRVFEGDLYAALPQTLRGRIDVLAVNAPYVPSDRIAFMPAEARDHEARIALDGGADGLGLQRRVAEDAPAWLAPGGNLLVETSALQAPDSAALLAAVGLQPRVVTEDERGGCIVIGTRPA